VEPVPFEIRREEPDEGIRVVVVRGELDMSTAPDLEAELQRAVDPPGGSVVLDLSECEFIDSTGIALIVGTWQKLGEGEDRLVLCCRNHQVRRLLKLTGVESSIPMHEERDTALAELRA
jgi:anti-sigma B factor antagonist